MRLTKLDRILSAEGELQPVVAKTRDLRALALLVQGFLSDGLAEQARVANMKEGVLTLLAANSAAAAKLRLVSPALCRLLQERRWQVNSVSIRVQPKNRTPPQPLGEKPVQLSAHALESLRSLYERLRPSPARDALARLLRRHGAL